MNKENDIIYDRNKKLPIIITIITIGIILLIEGFILYIKKQNSNKKESLCVEEVKLDGYISMNDQVAMSSQDVQYLFDSSFDTEFIRSSYSLDEVVYKICYIDVDEKTINFYAGSSNKTRKVESIELYNSNTLKKIKAKDVTNLLIELGYIPLGNYKKLAKFRKIESVENTVSDMVYKYYKLELELESGKIINAYYKFFDEQEDNSDQLVEGQYYMFDFDILEQKDKKTEIFINGFE